MAYMTVADLRDRVPSLANVDDFPDVVLSDLIAEFEEIAERYRGVAYTPRTAVETVALQPSYAWAQGTYGAASLTTDRYPIRSVTSITVNAVTQAATGYTVAGSVGQVWFTTPVSGGPIVITYSHGLDAPPTSVLRACREYVRASAVAANSGTSRDVIAQSTDGWVTRYATPDWDAGRPTGFLEVDRLLNAQLDYRVPGCA